MGSTTGDFASPPDSEGSLTDSQTSPRPMKLDRGACRRLVNKEGPVRWSYTPHADGIVAFDANGAEETFWTDGGHSGIQEPTANLLRQTSSQADHNGHRLGFTGRRALQSRRSRRTKRTWSSGNRG